MTGCPDRCVPAGDLPLPVLLRQQHPNLPDDVIEVGNTSVYALKWGFVRTTLLLSMPGNGLYPARVEQYVHDLDSGAGFTNPVMIMFDPDRWLAYVGEGNHRVAAAAARELSHVPAFVVRAQVRRDLHANGRTVRAVPWVKSPWTSGDGDAYWPPTMHPQYVFPNDTLEDAVR